MEVGIRELKAHLSDYLTRAEEGETIIVTLRGRPKAVLGPTVLADGADPVAHRIQKAIDEGWITPGTGRPNLGSRKGFRASKTAQQLLDEDRSE